MSKLAVLIALLLVAGSCSARRLPLGLNGHHAEPTPVVVPDRVSAATTASASGTDTASASGGGAVDGATRTTTSGGLAQATGTEVKSAVDVFGNSLTSSGTVSTRGEAAGAEGASITSTGQVITGPNAAASTGFTSGSFSGEGFFQAKTDTESVSPFGAATSSSEIDVTSDLGGYGSAASSTQSGPGGLISDSRAVGGNDEGFYGASASTAFTLGGFAGPETATSVARTVITPLLATSEGEAEASGTYGNTEVVVIDTARPLGAVTVGN